MTLSEFKAWQLEQEQQNTLEKYHRLNRFAKKGGIVFTGSSLMDFFPVNELLQSLDLPFCVYNRGITGYISSMLLEHIQDLILDLAPSKLFINIGTNDLGRGVVDELWGNYETILRTVQSHCPECKIYIMAYYPCNDADDFGLTEEAWKVRFATRNPASLLEANRHLEDMARVLGCRYIDVNDGIVDARGLLQKEYCIDGVHIYADGYVPVLKNLVPYLKE